MNIGMGQMEQRDQRDQVVLGEADFQRYVLARLQTVADLVGGRIDESRQGRPHLVIDAGNDLQVSVVWFEKSRTYRIFWPYPVTRAVGKRQERRDFSSAEGVETMVRTLGEDPIELAKIAPKRRRDESQRRRNW